jgi:GNAT superfamily N-acetyltransferase
LSGAFPLIHNRSCDARGDRVSSTSNSETLSAREIRFRLDELRLRVGGRLRVGLRSRGERIGLRRDLSVPHAAPAAKIPISVRPLQPADVPALLPQNGSEIVERANCQAMAAERPAACLVAVDERNGALCFMQWLFGANDRDYVAGLVGFPELASDEMLIEHAYVPPAYRGMGIMAAAMARIAERAGAVGARYALVFVGDRDIPALRRCRKAGFQPYLIHRQDDYAFGLVRRHRFALLDADDPRRSQGA